ncbi:DMT family transporter [Halomarina litorea]|uniref:DMT family transporter n=1 Tax=Halomarina litorea TaxID=2961595 RepID=UPI0020C24D7E|nr:EamA family transporter [Halomarina sp. BCD28]
MVHARVWRKLPLVPVLFVLLAAMWGTSFVFIKIGLEHFPPVLFAAVRYDVAGLVMLAYAVFTVDRWRPKGRHEWLSVLIAGAFVIAGYHALLYLGEQHVSGAVAAIVVSLAPVLTAVFASVALSEERIRGLGVVGLLFGFIGVVVVADVDPSSLAGANLAGVGLVFAGATCFALGSVLSRPLKTTLPARTTQAWAMLLGAGMLHVAGTARGETFAAVEWTVPTIVSLVYLTFVSGVVAFMLYFHLLDEIGPTELNLIGYLEPVVATLMSWLLLGELVESSTVVGFAAIFLGFALLKRELLLDVALSVRTGTRS